MPATRMLGRRWQVSTDVLPLFAIVSTCFYVLLLIYIVVAFFITVNVRGCNDTAVGRQYLATVCLFLTEYVVSMFTALCITFIGLRGTPLEASKRKLMVPFLYLQVLNWVIQLGVLGYGTYVVASLQPTHDCWKSHHRRDLTRVLVYVSWVMIMIVDWGRMLILYNIAPDLQRMSSWVWRLRILSWLTGNKDLVKRLRSTEDHPLERLTQLYTDLMRGVDLTPTDETVAMAAADLAPHLNHHQAANIYLGDRDAVDDETLHTASKFAKYAIAAYGQFGLDYKDETGHHGASWKLAMGKRFHSYKKNKLVRSKVKTHKQRLHYEAIIQVAQIQDEDLLYLNFTNAAMGDVPYIICLDRPTRSVVLSIRGTQSLADGATDLLAYPHPLHHWLPDCYREKEEAMYGHAGMLGAAAAVWEDLRTNHLLAALLDLPADEDCKPHHQDRGEQKYDPRMSHSEKERHMAWESGDACLSDEASAEGSPAKDAAIAGKHRSQGRSRKMESHGRHGHADRGLYKEGWKLVITGHSLGAGVAALLSLKMHQRAQGVKCWAFCPPGGLLSQNLSHAAEDYCTSIIVNKDMVPRLSLKTVYRLFEGKMIALARCNKTATRVLLHALRAGSRRVLLSDPRLFRPWSQVSSEAKDMLHRFQERPAEDSITTLGLEIGLYPPGRQIFLRRFKKESQPKRAEDVTWDAVWIQPEEIIGEGILVSKHAARDHYPFSLLSALEQVTDGAAGHVKRKTF
ncbi:hypothetical protein WJX79_010040 [Trebouxia sp. C0005]